MTNPAGYGPGDSEKWNYWAGIVGWQAVIGQNVELQWITPSPNEGKYCELKAHPDGNRGIKQPIGTSNRRSYVLVFYAAARADVDPGQSSFDVIISDSKQRVIANQSITFTDQGVWRQYAISFTATEAITNLSLVPTGPANTTGCLVDGLELSPVKIADNVNSEQTPSGVDAVSIIANTGCRGYQNKFWIMAPEGYDLSGALCSNDVKFLIPFDPPVTLKMSTPGGGNFLYEHPVGSASGPISLTGVSSIVRFKGTTDSSKDNTPIFKWGVNEVKADIPVRVKTMKRRTVKVQAIRVHRSNAQDLRPDSSGLDWTKIQETLNEIYGYQINAWFEVHFSDVGFDCSTAGFTGNDVNIGNNVEFRKVLKIINDDKFKIDPGYDVRVLLLDEVNLMDGVDILRGYTPLDGVLNMSLVVVRPHDEFDVQGNRGSTKTIEEIAHTVTHEIGHVFLEGGHPDEDGGIAPLPGTNRINRLMCSGPRRVLRQSRQLVKTEWDKADEWLKKNIDREGQ